MSVVAWVNGRLLDDGDAPALPVVDHAVTVGDAVFETAKVEHNVPFALRRHHERLVRSAMGLGLPAPDLDLLDEGIAAVLGARHLEFGRLRYSVTGGTAPLGSDRAGSPLTLLVMSAPQTKPSGSGAVVTVPWVRNLRSPLVGLKTTSYAENVVALAYAQDRGAVEAIFANSDGDLCEGTGSNVFVVSRGEVLTPPLESGPLAGISRGLVLEWAAAEGIPVREVKLPMQVLEQADEVFLTSSIKDVYPVHAVDGRQLGARPVTDAVASLFARRSAADPNP